MEHFLGSVLLAQLDETLLALLDRAELRHQIAVEQFAVPQVGEVEIRDVLAFLAGVEQLDRRDGEPFLIDVSCRRSHARRHERSDVHLVPLRDRPEAVLPVDEDRCCRDHVTHVSVVAVGVIADEDVAIVDVAFEGARDLSKHQPERGGVNGQRIFHCQLTVVGVIDGAGVVAAEGEDRCPCAALQRDGHLIRDAVEAAHDHAEGDRIEILVVCGSHR